MLLFVVVATALVWMDVSVRRMQRGDRAPVQSLPRQSVTYAAE
jgi:hypothetical protein